MYKLYISKINGDVAASGFIWFLLILTRSYSIVLKAF